MRVRPLTGNVLVQLDLRQAESPGGIALPDHTKSPEEHQQEARHPTPPPPLTGKVVEIGPWPKLRNGLAVLPPFGIGSRVVIRATAGIDLRWGTSGRLKMLATSDVLAVISE
jgi:co-chaperonin GroES (HSP10)